MRVSEARVLCLAAAIALVTLGWRSLRVVGYGFERALDQAGGPVLAAERPRHVVAAPEQGFPEFGVPEFGEFESGAPEPRVAEASVGRPGAASGWAPLGTH
jgi:hypothetical protein